ncbi:aldo/keto reductase [Haloarchaeobius sp. DFWS5]|uniref:aldo/keto reductase n=1 Tax=Haloarchaeobius sp. DFWS5 TaxID=3446114 RepID=UPI003EBB906A
MPIENQSDTFELGGTTEIHRLGFGAMRITGEDIIGRPDDEEAAHAVLQRAVELGVDFIDTADSYGPGVSERLINEALDTTRDDLTIGTKGGLLRNRDGDWLPNGDPDYLRNAHLCSTDRLGVDCIDLYQYHRPDPETDFEESLQALGELQDDGYIEHVGVSNVSVEQLDTARELVDVATVQNRYHVAYREEQDVLDACEEYGVGFIPWYPLGAGDLDEVGEDIDAVAETHDASKYQIALAWLLHTSDVTLPIPGTSSIEHLEQNVAASAIELSGDEVSRLDAAME